MSNVWETSLCQTQCLGPEGTDFASAPWERPQNFNKNTLFIRNDILNGRTISRNHFGIKVDDIAFRYIPPKTSRTKIIRSSVEVGDFNILSNK